MMKCKDCDQFEQCEYYNGRKGTSKICSLFTNNYQKITELEEIKAEMEDKLEPFILGERNLKKDALQILDNRIAEMKGE